MFLLLILPLAIIAFALPVATERIVKRDDYLLHRAGTEIRLNAGEFWDEFVAHSIRILVPAIGVIVAVWLIGEKVIEMIRNSVLK